jgi:galactokinase
MKLSAWLNPDEVVARLQTAGIGGESGDHCACRFVEAGADLAARGVDAGQDVLGYWIPGRIEAFGKHTDYCGGRSLLAAADRGFCMLAVPREDRLLVIADSRSTECCSFEIHRELEPRAGHWSNYPRMVAKRLAENFAERLRGATLSFSSNLPRSSGMSSSSAFVVGTYLIIAEINKLDQLGHFKSNIHDTEELAAYLGSVENGSTFKELQGTVGVGTFGGSEDHTAILCSRSDSLVLYSFCPVRFVNCFPFPEEYTFAIASSGVIAEKTRAAMGKYNRISALAAEILRHWNLNAGRSDPTLSASIASAPDATNRLRESLLGAVSESPYRTSELVERLEHFVVESQVIRSLPHRLDSEGLRQFGDLAQQSHDAAAKLLRNQTPETNYLVESARRHGAGAASSFGAGFGGSVWAIIERSTAPQFLAEWSGEYRGAFRNSAATADFFCTRPGPPATLLN